MEKNARITNAIETIGGFFICFVLVFIFFVLPDLPNIFPSEIGSYPVQKLPDENLMPLNRTIYKVNPFMQTVIYWMPNIDETPRKLVDCIVRDKKNWIGHYTDGSGAIKMSKGKIVSDNPNELYVGKYNWWLRHFNIL